MCSQDYKYLQFTGVLLFGLQQWRVSPHMTPNLPLKNMLTAQHTPHITLINTDLFPSELKLKYLLPLRKTDFSRKLDMNMIF